MELFYDFIFIVVALFLFLFIVILCLGIFYEFIYKTYKMDKDLYEREKFYKRINNHKSPT